MPIIRDEKGCFVKGSESPSYWLGKKMSKKHRQKLSDNSGRYWKGKHLFESTKRKISETRLKRLANGEIKPPWDKGKKRPEISGENHPLYGKHHTEKTKKKISKTLIHKGWWQGKNNPSWRGGTTPECRKRLITFRWERIRHQVYKRDNYTCQICGKTNCRIEAHHRIPYRINQDDDLENLISLCSSCHAKQEKILQKELCNA